MSNANKGNAAAIRNLPFPTFLASDKAETCRVSNQLQFGECVKELSRDVSRKRYA